MSTKQHGGKREGSGRKPKANKAQSVVMRIPEGLVDSVRALVQGGNPQHENELQKIKRTHEIELQEIKTEVKALRQRAIELENELQKIKLEKPLQEIKPPAIDVGEPSRIHIRGQRHAYLRAVVLRAKGLTGQGMKGGALYDALAAEFPSNELPSKKNIARWQSKTLPLLLQSAG